MYPCRGRYFLLVQKVTKDTLRRRPAGSTSSAKGALSLTGRASPRDPPFTGEPYTQIGRIPFRRVGLSTQVLRLVLPLVCGH